MKDQSSIRDIQKWETMRDNLMVETIKTDITLTSGTFIVSLAFLSNCRIMFYKSLLLISWVLLIFSLIMGMWAMTSGVTRYDRAVKGRKGELEGKEKELYEKGKVLTPFEAETPNLQRWSFTLGLLSFVLFVILNIWTSIKW